ncbi:PhzA/PhzB family protein [Actinoplanes sp. NBRC 103695]|uniref:PhzA/PhzB family protein n=1 Tax=Actinoplanes sp. NBRC 103695 TaxID=3032202 RepID=UPI0024A18C82|nr:PhzA/PhzB family protein [Actinoplanes sp. NBRC 103695]GLZ02068.1 phenazine biosynthesis protein PhzB 2 [Actinoplanes sp. NBRC 103695]
MNAFADDAELRRRNRDVVARYLEMTEGEARRSRHELFADDAIGGLWTTDTGTPAAVRGKERLGAMAAWSLECFPDWRWTNMHIYETQDPNHFWVECDGEGQILFPDYEPGHYVNHFIHSFHLDDGKITEMREFMNPTAQMRALGIDVPVVKRGGIPR